MYMPSASHTKSAFSENLDKYVVTYFTYTICNISRFIPCSSFTSLVPRQ